MKKVSVILGSESDIPQIEKGLEVLKDFGLGYDLQIISAHRNPDKLKKYVKSLPRKKIKVVIACAGLSAALPGAVSAYTDLPVIGVPLYSSAFKGIDSILSILQMPKGIPVGTVTVGKAGMINAALLTVRILSLNSKSLRERLKRFNKNKKK